MDLTDLLLLGIVVYFYYSTQNDNSNTYIQIDNNTNTAFPAWIQQNNETKLAQINPVLANKIRQIINIAFSQGYILYVDEGYRTQAKQNEYYAQGRTTPGEIITWTRNSKHTQGKAVDLMPVINGQPTNSLTNFDWQNIGRWANQIGGLIWGGNWQTKDYRHLEL